MNGAILAALAMGCVVAALGALYAARFGFDPHAPFDCPRFPPRVVPVLLAGPLFFLLARVPFQHPGWDKHAFFLVLAAFAYLGYYHHRRAAHRAALVAGAVLLAGLGLLRFGSPQWNGTIYRFQAQVRGDEGRIYAFPPPGFTGVWHAWERGGVRHDSWYRNGTLLRETVVRVDGTKRP